MIKVACLSCSAPYDLDERRLPATGLKMRCPKCGTSFAVFPDGRVAAAAAAGPGPKRTQLGIAPPANAAVPPPAAVPAPAAVAPPAPAAVQPAVVPPPKAPRGTFGGASRDELDLPAVAARPAGPKPLVPAPVPAPRAPAPVDDLELDLPAPKAATPRRPLAPPAAAPAAPPAPRRAPIAMGPTPAPADLDFGLPAPSAKAPAAAPSDDLDFDLPAPRQPAKRAPLAPEVELDLPAPRAAQVAPKAAAPTAAAPKAAAPKAAAPKAAAPAPPAELDIDLDLPAVRKPASPQAAKPDLDLELDLPAVRTAAPPAKPLAPPAKAAVPALADASRTPFDDDFDLPAPRGAAPAAKAPAIDLDLDLPAPRGATAARLASADLDLPARRGAPAARAASPGLDLDLPAPRGAASPSLDLDLPAVRGGARPAAPALGAAADDAFGDLDLPMPKSSAGGGDFGDLDLPAPRDGVDLPAVSRGVDLPAVSRGVDLPAVSRGVDLPAVSRGVDLPAVSRGVDLPAISPGRVDLPAPRGISDLPGNPLPLPGGDDGFGDLELPLPGGAARGAAPRPLGDDDDLELPLPSGGPAQAPRPSAGRGHGELDLGGGGDDMEFADIPQAAPDRAVAPTAARTSREPAAAKRAPAAPKPAGRSRAPMIVAGLFVLLAIGGGALTMTPLGPFGIHAIEPYLPWGSGDPAQIARVIDGADELARHDVRSDSLEALRQLGTARHEAGLDRTLLSRSLLHEALFDRRFGGDVGIATSAAAIRQRLDERGTDDPAIALGIAADELRQGDPRSASSFVERARQHAADDPFVDIVAGEIALAEDRAEDAIVAFRAAVEHQGGAAAQWGLARALQVAERTPAEGQPQTSAADVDAAIDATLAASPRHAGARVAKASRLWDRGDEAGALPLAREVVGHAPVEGEPLSASGRDRSDAWVLLGRIHERRGRLHQAREAYSAASEIDGTRVEALLGAGRTLLADRPSDALARFESVLEVEGAAAQQAASGRTARDEARLGRARALMAIDRLEEARTELETLAGEHAEDATIALWLGRAEERLDHDEAAEQQYREAVRLGPQTFEGYLALARLYVERDRNQDAIAVLEQARSQVPEDAEMREELGRFELSRNRLPQAITELRRALELDPALPAASFGLGVALRRSGQLDEAAAVFERTAELDPGHPGLALERGLLYEARGQADRAVEFYQTALTDRPDDAELLLRLGAAQVAANRIDDAATTLARVQEMLPSSAEAEHFLGRVAFARGQLPEASSHFERALSLDATRGEFHLYAAWAQIELGNIGRALERANAAIERDPSLGDAHWIRGRVRLRAGAVRDALTDLARALELEPERVEAHAEMGDCYDQLRQLPQAIASYERAVAARDTNGEWWYRLGRLRLDAGQRAEAARALGRATLVGDATTPEPHWLADAHRLQGDALRLGNERAGAIEHYRRYLDLAPEGAIDRAEVRRAMMDLGAVPPSD